MNYKYQIIEIEELDCIAGKPQHFEFAVAMYQWLISQLHVEMGSRLKGLVIEVIKVTYMGSYPSLGVRPAEGHEFRDISGQIRQVALDLLRMRPVTEFARFVAASERSWVDITSDMKLGN